MPDDDEKELEAQLASISPAEHGAALERILTAAGDDRDTTGHLHRPTGDGAAAGVRALRCVVVRRWRGELDFEILAGTTPVGGLRIAQRTQPDVLRVDWNQHTGDPPRTPTAPAHAGQPAVILLDRGVFGGWLRASQERSLDSFTAGRLTWLRRGRELWVVLDGVEHLFPAEAESELHLLAVR